MKNVEVNDLRSALELLESIPGQFVETDVEVDPNAELSGVYRHVGAGGTVEHPVTPVVIPNEQAKCQEVVHLATEEGFDIRKLLPAPTNTPEDAGPYITLGMCYASNPKTGESDVTIHRMCLQSKDEISIFLMPGARHIGYFRELAEAAGEPLPISVSIGVDPAIEIASCFEPPTTPLGYDELQAAGAIRNKPVELVQCLTINERAIANAEYVIEGEILPNVRVREDQNSNTGKAMPEFPGYCGPANPELPIIKVKAITTRKNPIMQFKKTMPSDEGRQRQAALLAFSAFAELKHVILVDEDVDIFDINDVMWAMTTRFQADVDLITIPGVQCHPLDPSNNPAYHPEIRERGVACKAIFDCTVPFDQKERFQRAQFMDVDPKHWLPDMF
ncbi:UbiD family decarboxylase [Blautia wexlerae]|jgi:3-polyprenyl-4-hydroxybenzoate decarboxylase|uniref:UbiD family decarboxylase n=1 Tax=Blautia wexlerae TaxID=418240 RepID=UPI00156D4558|nr:UbiD family decarboxylase [Blautia wexlerae]NSE03020.1 UbiD family decarboxylase [Blautia wexlerae]NSF76689.1 UbiD family decarboxylase [Blautia wexlerae]